ncbi:MAG TPA: alpha/beta hydrolase [Bryobacteraceae bacterium]
MLSQLEVIISLRTPRRVSRVLVSAANFLYDACVTRFEFLQTVTAGVLSIASPRQSSSQAPSSITVTYKTAGRCEIQADVFGASEGAAKPALMWIHGGALIFGNRKWVGTSPFHTRLLQMGYVIVSVDYRLAPETKLPGIIDDLQDAYRWVGTNAKRFGLDRNRIAVAGASAGGYLTQMAGFWLKPRPRVLVSYYGYGDIVGSWYSEPDEFYRRQPLVSKEDAHASIGNTPLSDPPPGNQRDKFYLYCRQNGLWPREVSGHDPHTEPHWFDRYCPIRNVTPQYPPTLLIHGTADTDVPYSLSKDMAAKLTAEGVEHELITVTDAGHGLTGAKPEEIDRISDRAVNFVKAHTT